MKDAIRDLKYYTNAHLDTKENNGNFWNKKENREQYLVSVVKSLLERPLSDESIEQLGATSLIFLSHRDDVGLKKWSELMYAVGNSLFLSLELRVPVSEWSDLAEHGRQILIKMANGGTSKEILNELNSFADKTYARKSELMNHPKYGPFIKSRDGMGGA